MSAGDELIHAFLGFPQCPTALGHEVLTLPDEEIWNKIDGLFQQPTSHIVALEKVLKQSRVSPVDFAYSHHALLNSIQEWKQAALGHRGYFECTQEALRRSDNPDGPGFLQLQSCTPPHMLTQASGRSYNDSPSTGSGYSNRVPTSGQTTYKSIERPKQELYPPAFKKGGDEQMSNFFRSLSLPKDDNWRTGATPNPRSFPFENQFIIDGATPAIIRPLAAPLDGRPPVPLASPIQRLSPLTAGEHYPSLGSPVMCLSAPASPVVGRMTSSTLNVANSQRDMSPIIPGQMAIKNVDARDYFNGSLLQPAESSKNAIYAVDNTLAHPQLHLSLRDVECLEQAFVSPPSDVSSVFDLLPPAPHSSPVMCGMDYLQRTSPEHPTALDMLREVSNRLGQPVFASQSDALADSLEGLLTEQDPSHDSKRPSLESETSNTAAQKLSSTDDIEPSTSETDMCSTQASSHRDSFRSSIGSSTSTWTCFRSERSSGNPWAISTFKLAVEYVHDHLGITCENEQPHWITENCLALLQLPLKPTSYQIDRACQQIQSHISSLAWDSGDSPLISNGTSKAVDRENSLAHRGLVISTNLGKLPGILRLVDEAAEVCRRWVRTEMVNRLGEKATGGIDGIDNVDPLVLLNLDKSQVVKIGTRFGEDMVRRAAAVVDLEIIKYSGCFGGKAYEEKLRNKVYEAMMNVADIKRCEI